MAMTIIEKTSNVQTSQLQNPKFTLKQAMEQAVKESDILAKFPQEMQKNIIAAAQYIVLTKLES